jgi:hypothetical protein
MALSAVFGYICAPIDSTTELQKPESWIGLAQKSAASAKELLTSERQEVALSYNAKTSKTTLLNHQIEERLIQLRTQYQHLFPNQPDPTDFELTLLQYLAKHYADFAQRLIDRNNKGRATDEWTTLFFKFCLRSPLMSVVRDVSVTHWIDIFVLYPNEVDQIMASHMDKRLGQYPDKIKILPGQGLCLEFDVEEGPRWIPLTSQPRKTTIFLRNRVIHSRNPYPFTIDEIFHEFKSKKHGYGRVEICEDGVVLWDAIRLGSKNPDRDIDLIDPKTWHESLPVLTLTYDQLLKRYPGQVEAEPRYGFALRANRKSPGLNVANTHGFIDFVYRLPDHRYRIVPISMQAMELPKTWWDRVTMLTKTQKAGIHLIDEGHFLSGREQTMHFFSLSNQEGEELIQLVSKEIEKSRKGELYFQANGKNCAYLVQKIVDRIMGKEFYKTIEKLATKQLGPSQITRRAKQLKEIVKSLDPEPFNQFMRTIIDKMIDTHDISSIHQLIESSLKTLHRLLQKPGKPAIPSIDQLRSAFRRETPQTIKLSLLQLSEVCFDALHPYRVHTIEGVITVPVIGHVLRLIRKIPWNWLRNFLIDISLFILGSWRWHTYTKIDRNTGQKMTRRVATFWSRNAGRYYNLPARLFESYGEESLRLKETRMNAALAICR